MEKNKSKNQFIEYNFLDNKNNNCDVLNFKSNSVIFQLVGTCPIHKVLKIDGKKWV